MTDRKVSRAPEPPPIITPSSSSFRSDQRRGPLADAGIQNLRNLKHAVWQCKELISAARTRRRFRGSLWDAEKKRWQIYRPLIDQELRLCRQAGFSDDPELVQLLPDIAVLDPEWAVACDLRQAMAAEQPSTQAVNAPIPEADPPMIAVGAAINGAVGLYASGITQVDADYDERRPAQDEWNIKESAPCDDAFASMISSAEQIRAEDEAWQEHTLRAEIERAENEVRQEQELHADIEKSVSNAGPSSRPPERTPAVDRVVLVPPCSVDIEGYAPFSWAVYWMVPKEIIDSKAGIKVRDWEAGCSKLVSWIGSKKVTLIGRRPGEGENRPLPPELLANHPVVDWGFDSFSELDGSRKHLALPWPNTPFLRCCYCPDYEHWQRGEFNDQFFNSKHRIEWTHLQANMAEVTVASEALRRFKPDGLLEAEVGEARSNNRDAVSLDCVWQVLLDAGDAPLFEAVHWIATKGGSVSFDPDLWPDAWAKIASAWRKDELTVFGRPSGRPAINNSFPERISGNEIAGVRCIPPYPCACLFGDPSFGTGPCIEFWGRSDRMSWEERGFNDKLFVPGHGGWTHLTVLKADVEGLSPFWSTAPPEADGIDPAGHEHKEPNVLKIAKRFVEDGIAPNAREHTTLVMSTLKKEYPGNHPKREEVEELLTVEFKNQRRPRGRTSRAR